METTSDTPIASTPPAAETIPAAAAVRPATSTVVFALAAFVIGLLVGGLLFNTGVSSEQLETVVRSVVAEEIAKMQSNPQMANLADNDPFFGPEDAPITIVEFSDFYCTFCTRFATQTLPRLQEAYGDKIKFVYRDMPIIGGQISLQAAVAANCAHDQGKFWDFHNLLFNNNQARDTTAFIGFADELGLDTDTFQACLSDQAKVNEVTLDLLDGQALGISGTPAFYINGRFVSGAQPFETFALLIDTELARLGLE